MSRRLAPIALPALLLLASPAPAAHTAPVQNREARAALEALQKKLPDVLSAWGKECLATGEQAEVRLVRRVAPEEAKVVIALGTPEALARRPTSGTASRKSRRVTRVGWSSSWPQANSGSVAWIRRADLRGERRQDTAQAFARRGAAGGQKARRRGRARARAGRTRVALG
jgi:hypothetical protein